MNTKDQILNLAKQYFRENKKKIHPHNPLSASLACFNEKEVIALVSAALDMRWVEGGIVHQFEREMARYMGTRFAIMTNSGSSANLLAFSALTSSLLKTRALTRGDEIITVAAGFPTTVNPIIQNGMIPVFVDVNIGTYNTTSFLVDRAINEKTRGIFIAHTLGNPFDADEVRELARLHDLWFIEDCADALGAEIDGQKVGTFGALSTTSFYPAHLMTVGEGGMVFTNDPLLAKIVRSFRDWGRDCWCLPGKENTCGKRFGWKHCGELPDNYDHKYIYSHVGYNLKSTDLQAAIGLEQLKKLPEFLEDRRENWKYLKSKFIEFGLDKFFILPNYLDNVRPAWFGFLITIKESAKFTRDSLLKYLNTKNIGTRLLFAGNLTKQPAYIDKVWRIHDDLPHTNIIMSRTFWIGCHPSMTKKMLDYIVLSFQEFIKSYEN